MKAVFRVFLALLLVVVSGCSGVKNLAKPEIDLPAALDASQELDSLTLADLGWWEFYGDEYLRDMIEKVLEENRQLQMAAQRIAQAQH